MADFLRRKRDGVGEREVREYLGEQVGLAEDDLKSALVKEFLAGHGVVRAYLAVACFGNESLERVVLAVCAEGELETELESRIRQVFNSLFSDASSLDLVQVTGAEESALRRVCLPFFTAKPPGIPDWRLSSSESKELSEPRNCTALRRLANQSRNDLVECSVAPAINGEPFGLHGESFDRIVVATRHAGESLLQASSWPQHVHVAVAAEYLPQWCLIVHPTELNEIAWAELTPAVSSR